MSAPDEPAHDDAQPGAEGGDESDSPRRRGWGRRLLRPAAELAVVVVLLSLVGGFTARKLLARGSAAPPLVVETLDGDRFDLATHRGQRVVVHFWATWCSVCRLEGPAVARLARAHDDVAFIAVAEDQDAEVLRAYVAERELPYQVASAARGDLDAWSVTSYPTTYVIGAGGQVRARRVGLWTDLGLRFALFRAQLAAR